MKNFIVNIVVKGHVSITHSAIDEEDCKEWAEKWGRETADKLDGHLGGISTEIEIIELKGNNETF